MQIRNILLFTCVVLLLSHCETEKAKPLAKHEGKLFIIGGGKRPGYMIERLVKEADLENGGYGIILPMSSSEPDSAIYYAKLQFIDAGLTNVVGMNLSDRKPNQDQLDSIAAANMIYISGGDQNRFMIAIESTEIAEAIYDAYTNGNVIAGTSAGAAVMSEIMITGDERNYPEYRNTLRNVEKNNIITSQGLGLIDDAIIDQHFIKRARYNRLLSAVADNPTLLGIGIDEATAILVDEAGKAEIIGDNQVVVVRTNANTSYTESENKLNIKNLEIDVLTKGQTFYIPNTKK